MLKTLYDSLRVSTPSSSFDTPLHLQTSIKSRQAPSKSTKYRTKNKTIPRSAASSSAAQQHKGAQSIIIPASFRERDYGTLQKSQYSLFVQFFRQASPYIEGHRGRTFVIAIPGEIVDNKELLYRLLEDVALLHGLGVKLVLVVGARMQINEAIIACGMKPTYAGGYRVTDSISMKAAIQAAGAARMEVEARLSKGPTVTMIRRHARGGALQNIAGNTTLTTQAGNGNTVNGIRGQYAPAVTTVSGNYVAAKRKGVVNGVDYEHTGVVRFIQKEAVQYQLDSGNIVLLSNLGYSAAGEVLNCDTYTVAVRAAVDLHADKLIVVTLPEVHPLALPAWLPLQEAESLLQDLAAVAQRQMLHGDDDVDQLQGDAVGARNTTEDGDGHSLSSSSSSTATTENSMDNNEQATSTHSGHVAVKNNKETPFEGQIDQELDFDRWYELGLPLPLLAAYMACRAGIKRAHLIDARMDGSLLLELYSRDGVGVMVSTDFYEGIRAAAPTDIQGILDLLDPLVEKGVLVRRTRDQLTEELQYFTIVERESRVLACATVKPLGKSAQGEEVAELAAFCVHPEYRGSGKGDSLLEYLESEAREKGVEVLVLLTTRTADWFEQRGFRLDGQAHVSELLPVSRRDKIDASRNSQLYYKDLRK